MIDKETTLTINSFAQISYRNSFVVITPEKCYILQADTHRAKVSFHDVSTPVLSHCNLPPHSPRLNGCRLFALQYHNALGSVEATDLRKLINNVTHPFKLHD